MAWISFPRLGHLPQDDHLEYVEWRRREFNDQADYICNVVLDLGKPVFHIDKNSMQETKRRRCNFLVFSDGGFRDGVAVGAWIAYAMGDFRFKALVAQGFKVPPPHDAFGAEAIALETAASFLLECLCLNTNILCSTAYFSIV